MLPVRRALAVGAHPDDVELSAGGLLATWARAGVHVEIVCLTAGERGVRATDDLDGAGARRRHEALAAAMVLGARRVHFLGAVDGELEPGLALRRALARVVRLVRADVVVGHDPWRRWLLHPDHRAAGLLTVDAVVAARDATYPVAPSPLSRAAIHDLPFSFAPADPLVTTLVPSGTLPVDPPAYRPHTVLLFGSDEPDEVVDISDVTDVKLAALRAHASQVPPDEELRRQMNAWHAAVGAPHGLHAAEVFHTLDTRGR